MNKYLSELLGAISVPKTQNESAKNPLIQGLAYDSRAVKKDFLFFALPGIHIHGNEFIVSAIQNGAAAVFYQDNPSQAVFTKAKESGTVLIKVENTRTAMAPVAETFYDFPSQKMAVIGVTGTEGKSTTVSFIWQLLTLAGKKAGFISTVEYSLGGEAIENPEHQTTPEAPVIQEKLHMMLQNGCEYAVIESSSHGLSKKTNRLGGVLFDGAAFMNVTHEHLEFHGTHEQYKFDKANLFRALDAHSHTKQGTSANTTISAIGAVNLDDAAAAYFADCTTHEVWGFTLNEEVPVPQKIAGFLAAANQQIDETGVTFTLKEYTRQNNKTVLIDAYQARINTPGSFNLYNTMAALIIVSKLTGHSVKELARLAEQFTPVRGRMTAIRRGQPFEVIVDYAHTPSSFQTIFPPLRQRAKGKIISLFGSGGERDVQKRPVQGKIASEYSDILILADEDPRGEDSMELLEMIAAGCPEKKRDEELFLIPDRKAAIRKAFLLAKPGDMVLLLGKGHENSIIFKTYAMKYDEIDEAKKALAEIGFVQKI